MKISTRIAAATGCAALLAVGLHAATVVADEGHGNHSTRKAQPGGHHAGQGHGHQGFGFGQPGKLKDVRKIVWIKATDIKFNKKVITVRVGQTVKFNLKNNGEQDHEMTIGDAATQAAHRKQMAAAQKKGQKMDHGHGHGNAAYVKPGQSKSLVWKFTKAGTFEFGCNIPGHYEAGMKGKIIVK